MLDSWQERLKVEKKVNRALESIVLEVQTFTDMDVSIEYNTKNMNALDSMIRRHRNGESTNFSSGVARPEVRSLAWMTSRENGIAANFDRQVFIDMTEIYVEFDRLEKILAYNREFSLKSDPGMPPVNRAIHKRRQLDRIIFRSQELQARANEFLEKYKSADFTQLIN